MVTAFPDPSLEVDNINTYGSLLRAEQPSRLAISNIRSDGGTQTRVALNYSTLNAYKADMLAGAAFPPVIVFYDGIAYWLADGFHRLAAAKQLGRSSILTHIIQGTQRMQFSSRSEPTLIMACREPTRIRKELSRRS